MAKHSRFAQAFDASEDLLLDGVYYGEFTLAGRRWRAGALAHDWKEKLCALTDFSEARFQELAQAGIWIEGADSAGKIGVMCCGLGSSWPGMGRELYVSFPVCRMAMDQIASYANWDILGLMDDPSLDRISLTRWQIPYLFMIEYAQWRQFQKLGMRPDVVCGHSLGELIALCVAGVYDARGAWELFETRALHMADLEAKSGKQGGMLAVPATEEQIATVMEKWPDLRISNRNTPTQFILSGQRGQLLEARKYLRRQRVPAVMLNMDLAFHNPAMRVARDLSVLRLNGLDMRPSSSVMLSCVTGRPYPADQAGICDTIADLDENTVDWAKLTANMAKDHAIGTFLELGPQATLCGLVSELAPGCVCIPADRRSHEGAAMREACARLFAAGFLNIEAIRHEIGERERAVPARLYSPAQPRPGMKPENTLGDIPGHDRGIIIQIVAETTGKSADAIRLDQDLRHDLGLRSATFPFLMMQAEQRLGRPVRLENLFELATVADLVRFLAGAGKLPESAGNAELRADFLASRSIIGRYGPDGMTPAPFNPAAKGFGSPAPLLMLVDDKTISPRLLAGVAAAGYEIGIPPNQEPDGEWREWNPEYWRQIWPPAHPASPGNKPVTGIVLALAPCAPGQAQAGQKRIQEIAENFGRSHSPDTPTPWLIVIQRFIVQSSAWQPQAEAWLAETADFLAGYFPRFRAIAWLTPETPSQNYEYGDLLVWEIERGEGDRVIWNALPDQTGHGHLCPASEAYDLVRPDSGAPVKADGSAFRGAVQFSLFRQPELASHGANAIYHPRKQTEGKFAEAPWLPLGEMLFAMNIGASLRAPWLRPAGFQDLHVFDFPALPPGVARECRLAATPRQELPLEKTMTRLCAVELEVAAITANGRKNGSWLPAASCAFLQCREIPDISRRCKPMPLPVPAPLPGALLYEALGFSPEWQFLEEISSLALEGGYGVEAHLRLAESALESQIFQMVESAMIGALAAAALPNADTGAAVAAALSPWRFSGIGFARFDVTAANDAHGLVLRVYPAWRSERLLRYNAQIRSSSSAPVMVIHNLEFDRILPCTEQERT